LTYINAKLLPYTKEKTSILLFSDVTVTSIGYMGVQFRDVRVTSLWS